MTPFPKDVNIQMTAERAEEDINKDDYEEGSSQFNQVIEVAINDSKRPIAIKSWKDLKKIMPKGYELADQDDIEEHRKYLESLEIP